ncbi:hypothetical protein B0I32_14048 [Nonomuraea fuscirosea]|uniref:Uncharacterized protein n=1 Tax=Nonomuraea fuscirosea TaxID=1291556 RepID=A0A2T0LXQ0_9ACTN|nr:hypothetical protein [Nonomuraea fuscirosea]PRX48803.1 hypothetical protein B0I32_14048 [Nonomuraea fuscirosea]
MVKILYVKLQPESEGPMKRVLMAMIAAALVAGGVGAAVVAPASADSVHITAGETPDNRDM